MQQLRGKLIMNKTDEIRCKLFGIRLKKIRIEKGFTRVSFAKKIKQGETCVWIYEEGFRFPNVTNLLKICRALNITPNDLIGTK